MEDNAIIFSYKSLINYNFSQKKNKKKKIPEIIAKERRNAANQLNIITKFHNDWIILMCQEVGQSARQKLHFWNLIQFARDNWETNLFYQREVRVHVQKLYGKILFPEVG